MDDKIIYELQSMQKPESIIIKTIMFIIDLTNVMPYIFTFRTAWYVNIFWFRLYFKCTVEIIVHLISLFIKFWNWKTVIRKGFLEVSISKYFLELTGTGKSWLKLSLAQRVFLKGQFQNIVLRKRELGSHGQNYLKRKGFLERLISK